MSWTALAIQLVSQLGSALVERFVKPASERKQEPEKANPVDIAIATKSHVSADREGKLASERARQKRDTWRNPPSLYEEDKTNAEN
jgi:hypothetical protein